MYKLHDTHILLSNYLSLSYDHKKKLVKNMKIWKILISVSILFLLIGVVAATDINKFQTPDNCEELKEGVAAFTNHIDRMLYVEKVSGNYENDWFSNTSDMTVKDMGDNIYWYSDDALKTYGYEEIVEIDGDTYMISINQGSQLSPSEEKMLLEDMKEFNKLNNLEPVEI